MAVRLQAGGQAEPALPPYTVCVTGLTPITEKYAVKRTFATAVLLAPSITVIVADCSRFGTSSLKTYTVLVVGSRPTLIAFTPVGIEVDVSVAPLMMVALLLS
jgi:hypothetical protein